jgi:glycosyltransferase involved in cell wall biosynthesis
MKLYYSAADLVCMPSLEEGWPDALMESFSCGCPWVASDVGGVSDMLALTGAGAVVPAAQPDALAAALSSALTREWDREALAAKMETYTLEQTARDYVASCEQAVSEYAR